MYRDKFERWQIVFSYCNKISKPVLFKTLLQCSCFKLKFSQFIPCNSYKKKTKIKDGQIIEAILSFCKIHTHLIQNTQNLNYRQQTLCALASNRNSNTVTNNLSGV